jgi:perosamine synthetase
VTGYIHQMAPWVGEEERQAVSDYLDSGGWLTEFTQTRSFERAIADYVGSRHASMVTSGTVSLFVALSALDIGAGDEVIVPAFSMIASANAVLMTGATPVFVDVDADTLCLDLDVLDSAITARTKAVMLVSLNGRSPDIDRLQAICARHRVPMLEDSAQSLGSRRGGRHLGTFGRIGSFSFSAPKVITTGQGGALVTDDDDLMARIQALRDFGRRRSGIDEHVALGFNFKFTDLQAVIGLAQMRKLEERVRRKKEMFARYQAALADVPQVTFLPTDLNDTAPWFVDVLVPDPAPLLGHLHQRGIGSRPFYPSIPTQAPYRLSQRYPRAEFAAQHGLWLPSSCFLDDRTIDDVAQAIRDFYQS